MDAGSSDSSPCYNDLTLKQFMVISMAGDSDSSAKLGSWIGGFLGFTVMSWGLAVAIPFMIMLLGKIDIVKNQNIIMFIGIMMYFATKIIDIISNTDRAQLWSCKVKGRVLLFKYLCDISTPALFITGFMEIDTSYYFAVGFFSCVFIGLSYYKSE